MYDHETLSKKLKEGREYRKLSVRDVAKLFNIRPESYSRWERGKAKPKAAQITRIANAEKLDINYFFLPDLKPEEADWDNKVKTQTLESLARQMDELKTYIMGKESDDELRKFISVNQPVRDLCSRLMSCSLEVRKQIIGQLQEALAKSINQMEKGQKIPGHTLEKNPEDKPPREITIPFYGQIAAGKPLHIEEYVGESVTVPETYLKNLVSNRYYAVKAKGDSMIEADITDGDIVILKARTTAEDGDIVAVNLDGEATLKKIFFKEGAIELHPCNRNLKPQIVKEEDILIQGVFAGVVKDYKIHWLEHDHLVRDNTFI